MSAERAIVQMQLLPGRTPGGQSQNLELTSLTVFVGPNNSGKSLALREIGKFITEPNNHTPRKITGNFKFAALTPEQAKEVQDKFEREPPPNQPSHPENMYLAHRGGAQGIGKQHFLHTLQHPEAQSLQFRQLYLSSYTTTLGGENRIALTNPQQAGSFQTPDPFHALQVLFANDGLREKVRAILYRAFKQYFILDPTHAGQLTIRFSTRSPIDVTEEQGLHKKAREFYAASHPIAESSDGVKAYTGIVTQIIAGEPKIILIDEPEAFLHPPLAYQLGKEIAEIASEGDKNVLVSTHSASFVMGCLQTGPSTDIVRLTYTDGTPTARVLNNKDVLSLTKHPLLRSTGVINALFHEFVIVTESDSDRAFYQEINDRLLKTQPSRGIPNCLFLNAQNKQTTRIITKPLRALGIPTLSIVDIDVLKEGGNVWKDFLDSGYVPELERKSLETSRSLLKKALEDTGKDMKKDGGVDLLAKGDREALNNLFDRLEEYGLFVVRGGEVESWLKHLGATKHGSQWLIDMFDKLGTDLSEPDYVEPAAGDVWDFLERAKTWLMNSKRKGIPE